MIFLYISHTLYISYMFSRLYQKIKDPIPETKATPTFAVEEWGDAASSLSHRVPALVEGAGRAGDTD